MCQCDEHLTLGHTDAVMVAVLYLTPLVPPQGFVSENPTAPIQLVRRRAPPCLNEFCRLGCICSSLSHCSRISHCGRPPCMLGCSCLKQKVVLLKNLDGSDSSPSHQGINKKRKRKRRMKMAYSKYTTCTVLYHKASDSEGRFTSRNLNILDSLSRKCSERDLTALNC